MAEIVGVSSRALRIPICLAMAAVLVATWWRISVESRSRESGGRATQQAPAQQPRIPAPPFALFDQHRHLVKLERYFSRTPILLAFIDASGGIESDPWFQALREQALAIERLGLQVVVVAQLTPAELQRQAAEAPSAISFPVLADIEIENPHPAPAHALYGMFDETSQSTRRGLFLIDRRGMVAGTPAGPRSIQNPEQFLTGLRTGHIAAE